MKNFKKLVCCTLVITCFISISGSKATTYRVPAQRYETVICGTIDPTNGDTTLGTQCKVPDSQGPCYTTSECQ